MANTSFGSILETKTLVVLDAHTVPGVMLFVALLKSFGSGLSDALGLRCKVRQVLQMRQSSFLQSLNLGVLLYILLYVSIYGHTYVSVHVRLYICIHVYVYIICVCMRI